MNPNGFPNNQMYFPQNTEMSWENYSSHFPTHLSAVSSTDCNMAPIGHPISMPQPLMSVMYAPQIEQMAHQYGPNQMSRNRENEGYFVAGSNRYYHPPHPVMVPQTGSMFGNGTGYVFPYWYLQVPTTAPQLLNQILPTRMSQMSLHRTMVRQQMPPHIDADARLLDWFLQGGGGSSDYYEGHSTRNGPSLLDLPSEVVDRINLRSTCKRLRSLVAESDIYIDDLFVDSLRAAPWFILSGSKHSSVIKKQYIGVPDGLLAAHRLFRFAHITKVSVNHLNYRIVASNLLTLSESLRCSHLEIRACVDNIEPRMFEIVDKLKPRMETHLILDGETPIHKKEKYFLNLQPLRSFVIHTLHSSIQDDAIILELVEKHGNITLGVHPSTIQLDTFRKVVEIAALRNHCLSLTVSFELLLEMLHSFGVIWNGRRLVSMDPEIKVTTKLLSLLIETVDYQIELGGTSILICGLIVAEKCNSGRNLNITIGRKK